MTVLTHITCHQDAWENHSSKYLAQDEVNTRHARKLFIVLGRANHEDFELSCLYITLILHDTIVQHLLKQS